MAATATGGYRPTGSCTAPQHVAAMKSSVIAADTHTGRRKADVSAQLNRDVVTLQKAMVEIWHMSGDAAKIVIEKAMAETGMLR